MRTIKFRGIRTRDLKWIYGDLVHKSFDGSSKTIEVGIRLPNCYADEVIPESIGQFTGLALKNGILLYEGDKVLVKGRKKVKEYETEIIWEHQSFILLENHTYLHDYRAFIAITKVTGTIHDNLLGE